MKIEKLSVFSRIFFLNADEMTSSLMDITIFLPVFLLKVVQWHYLNTTYYNYYLKNIAK